MKIKTVIFDLDNTLYAESVYFQEIFNQFCLKNSIKIEKFQFLFDQFDHFRFTKKDIFKFALEETNLYSSAYHDALFNLFIELSCIIEPYEGVNEWIDYCITENIQIGVLTNGIIKAQQNKWNCLKINNKEKIQFTPSREFENDKPNVVTFEKFMFQLNANWETTLFVGDRFENDLEQGLENGSQGILIGYESKHKSIPAFHTIQEAFNYFQTL